MSAVKLWQSFLLGNKDGIVMQGKEPARKCLATTLGHHPRAVYSLDWGQGELVTGGSGDTISVFREEREEWVCAHTELWVSVLVDNLNLFIQLYICRIETIRTVGYSGL